MAPSLHHIYRAGKIILTIGQIKARKLRKSQFSNSYVNWEKIGSTALANIQNPMGFLGIGKNWEKLERPARVAFKNIIFPFLCQFEKTWKYSLRSIFKNANFESIDELGEVIS